MLELLLVVLELVLRMVQLLVSLVLLLGGLLHLSGLFLRPFGFALGLLSVLAPLPQFLVLFLPLGDCVGMLLGQLVEFAHHLCDNTICIALRLGSLLLLLRSLLCELMALPQILLLFLLRLLDVPLEPLCLLRLVL